jgi:hypothetical protein
VHANQVLTPRARLRLAQVVVDQAWPIARKRNGSRCPGRPRNAGPSAGVTLVRSPVTFKQLGRGARPSGRSRSVQPRPTCQVE